MKRFILWLIKTFKVDIPTEKLIEKTVEVEKTVYIPHEGVINGNIAIKGDITVLGSLEVEGDLMCYSRKEV